MKQTSNLSNLFQPLMFFNLMPSLTNRLPLFEIEFNKLSRPFEFIKFTKYYTYLIATLQCYIYYIYILKQENFFLLFLRIAGLHQGLSIAKFRS